MCSTGFTGDFDKHLGLKHAGGLSTFSLATAADLCFSIRYSAANDEEVNFVPFPELQYVVSLGEQRMPAWIIQRTVQDLYQTKLEIERLIV